MSRTGTVILVHGAVGEEHVAALARRHEVLTQGPETLTEVEAGRVRVVVTMGIMRTDRVLMERLPGLRLVCCTGSGFEGVDLRAAAERGIAVTHGPDTNASAVADMAMALMLAAVRGVVAGDRLVRSGGWAGNDRAAPPLRRGLTGARLGIYGLGTIGLQVAHRAEACEMEVAYHGRQPRLGLRYAYHPNLVVLAGWADVLVVAVRAGPENRHAVDARVLAALGPEGYLVNVARGSVVDEDALVHALRTGGLAGAGLDVYAREPLVPAGLTGSDRVVLTPHLGGSTTDAQERMRELLLANIAAHLDDRPLPSPVPISPTG